MRADATRNRAAILTAARDLLARNGDVTMEEVAADAGVAVGTLYRHFPGKAELVYATLELSAHEYATLAEAALERYRAGTTANAALRGFMRAMAAEHVREKAVKEVAASLGFRDPVGSLTAAPDGPGGRALTAVVELLSAAQKEHAIRADVTVGDLLMFLAVMPGAEHPAASRQRYVDVVMAGLAAD